MERLQNEHPNWRGYPGEKSVPDQPHVAITGGFWKYAKL
jgi:hypothetical protein